MKALLAALLLPCAMLGTPAIGHAQAALERQLRGASAAPDLELPTSVSSFSFFTSPRLALYKPEGAGPFPALVLLHQCGGLTHKPSEKPNVSMQDWAKKAVARGFVVLMLDSLSQRKADSVCDAPVNGVYFARGAKDALLGAAHLKTFDFVDPKRIVMAGYSWGAAAGLLASSQPFADSYPSAARFAAVASFYPPCHITPRNAEPFDLLIGAVDRPLLVLMGGQDNETPPQPCLRLLEAQKAAGAPVEWQVYEDATHCWDCSQLDGFMKFDARNNVIRYRHDRKLTEDSATRMFDFFERAFAR
jgi:dienelactone hydrolase